MSDETRGPESAPPAAPPQAPRRSSRWLKIALVASLAVNLLIVGAVIGRWSRAPGFYHGGPHAGWVEGRRMFRELPRERRLVILRAMRDHRDAFKARREAIRTARRDAAEVLRQDDATSQEIGSAFKALGHEEGAAVEAFRSVIGEVVAVMTPEERREFARRVLKREPPGFASELDGD